MSIESPLKKNDQQEKINLNFRLSKSESQSVKKIKFSIKNPGLCPDWHLGAGNKSWVFIDEISFE